MTRISQVSLSRCVTRMSQVSISWCMKRIRGKKGLKPENKKLYKEV